MNPGADGQLGQASDSGRSTIVVERPAPGLYRGKWPVPAWSVVALGVVLVAVTVAWYAWRWRRAAA